MTPDNVISLASREWQPCLPGMAVHRCVMRELGLLSISDIQRAVSDYYRLPTDEMKSARRDRRIARPRQIAMYLARQFTPKSLPDIGRRFGNRDHTTVIHGIRQIERLAKIDANIANDIQAISRRLG